MKWYRGTEMQHFTVEKGISRELQMNIDLVVKMPCNDVRVNVQDASGDHIMAGLLLTKDNTNWDVWNEKLNQISSGVHEYQTLNSEATQRLLDQEQDVHARHVLQHTRKNPRRKFPKSPKLSSKQKVDSCRIYGSLEGNKVHGDFHITVRSPFFF
jgi:endoplasmic reticulum-Golgi intermediate compartment protein 2